MTPPVSVRAIASNRNWRTMSRRRAPSALRTPISCVRSVTLTSMMFITPIPPTSRLTLEMAIAIRPIAAVMPSNCWMIRSAVERSKFDGSFARTPRRRRSISSTWSSAVGSWPLWARMTSSIQSLACGATMRPVR